MEAPRSTDLGAFDRGHIVVRWSAASIRRARGPSGQDEDGNGRQYEQGDLCNHLAPAGFLLFRGAILHIAQCASATRPPQWAQTRSCLLIHYLLGRGTPGGPSYVPVLTPLCPQCGRLATLTPPPNRNDHDVSGPFARRVVPVTP